MPREKIVQIVKGADGVRRLVEQPPMTLEQQVCSLELATRLRDLGVKQESYFWWYPYPGKGDVIVPDPWKKQNGGLVYTSAFTVAELGEMLPYRVEQRWLTMSRCAPIEKNRWIIGYCKNKIEDVKFVQQEATEADARAKMLIYLLENKLITL
jgi:hypothetical protein